jgi:hypothetical protein
VTNQTINAKVGNATMTRTFVDSAVDGTVFTTNNLLDTNAQQNLGILIPNQVVNSIQVQYNSGLAQWRCISSQNQIVSRYGFGSLQKYVCPSETTIIPYKIQPTDLLQIFCKPATGVTKTAEVMAWLTTTGGIESFQATTADDDTGVAMTNSITGQTLGDWAFNQTFSRIQMQAQDGAFISSVEVKDQTGSVVWSTYGSTRLPTAGGKSTLVNLDIPCSLNVQKGWSIEVQTITA